MPAGKNAPERLWIGVIEANGGPRKAHIVDAYHCVRITSEEATRAFQSLLNEHYPPGQGWKSRLVGVSYVPDRSMQRVLTSQLLHKSGIPINE